MSEALTGPSVRLAETKLMVPTSCSWSLERPTLIDLLDAAAPTRLLLLVAPAGYGKTMLVEAWLRGRSDTSTIGWLSLDSFDDDPVRFWGYLVECAGRLGATTDERLLDEVRADPSAAGELGVELVNALGRLDVEHVVVLDDLHVVQREEVLDPLLWLIEAAPPTTTFVVTSRTSPPWPLERLRASGETIVVDETNLAFQSSESAAVLTAMAPNVELSDTQIQTLHDRTEGWPVAVQLAAQTLRRHPDHERLLEDVGAVDRAVVGYFLEEVLAGLSPELHRFLLDISVCERFSTDLATDVVGERVEDVVKQVLDEHLFAVSLDAGGEWYRLHHLIRSLLLEELSDQDPGRVRTLHRRAAAWHVENGDTSTAIDHLLGAEEFDEAFARIVEVTNDQWVRGRAERLLRWLRALPVDHLEQRPAMAARLALNLTMLGRFDEARSWLDLADRATTTTADRRAVTPARIALEFLSGHVSAALEALSDLDDLTDTTSEPPSSADPFAQPVNMLMVKSLCHEILGEEDHRRDVLAEFNRRRSELSGLFALSVDGVIGRLEAENGELDAATDHASRALEQARQQGIEFQSVAHAHFAMARIAWCEGRLGDAQAALVDMARIDHGHAVPGRVLRAVGAAEVYASCGRHDRADDVLEDAWHGEPAASTPMDCRGLIAGWGMWICSVHDRELEAREWIKRLERVAPNAGLPPALSSRYSLVNGRPQDVISTFCEDGSQLPSKPLPWLRCCLVLHAALHVVDGPAAAHELLDPLLRHAERHNLVQPVVDDRRVSALLDLDRGGGQSHLFWERLRQSGPTTRAVPHIAELVEQISPREFDVIPFLPTRKTNREIASELYVSLNTVKTHLRSLYRKLGVSTRGEAIHRCQELGLL